MKQTKTPGQIAYETDVQHTPVYHDGMPRRSWYTLDKAVQRGWENNPTPKHTKPFNWSLLRHDLLLAVIGVLMLTTLWLVWHIDFI